MRDRKHSKWYKQRHYVENASALAAFREKYTVATTSPLAVWWDKDQYGNFAFTNTSSIQDAQVLRLAKNTANDMSYLANMAVQQLAQVMMQYRAGRQAIQSDKMISTLAMTQQLQALRTRALDAVDAIDAKAKQAIADVRTATENAPNTIMGAPAAPDKLVQMQIQADGWRRVQSLLARPFTMQAIITFAAQDGDTAMLAAIRAELPVWIRTVTNDKDRPGALEAYMLQLDAAETPLLGAIYQAQRALIAVLNPGAAHIQTDVGSVRDFITTGHEYISLLGFMPGTWTQTLPTIDSLRS